MRDLDELKRLIEAERQKLDKEMEDGDMKAHYRRSLTLDVLIEEYLDIKDNTMFPPLE